MQKGLELEVVINDSIYPNIGIVNYEGKEIRIKDGIKGTKAIIRITRKRKKYLEAKIYKILEKSPLIEESNCPHFGICGGCSYQNMSYKNELKYKEEQVRNLFEYNNMNVKISSVKPSPDIQGYRNKMEFTFGDEYKDGPLNLGMHRKGAFYEIENVKNCNIADCDFTKILDETLDYFRNTDLTFYHKRRHIGSLRHLVVRKAMSTNEILINLVTSSQYEIDTESFKNMILKLELEGEIVGIFHTINDQVADIVKSDSIKKLYGKDYIIEEICGLKFKISPFSFFQTNTFGAEKLYNIAQDYIGDIDNLTVFDLYSGTGTIAQIMAKVAKKVVAVELVEEAVQMAKENAKLNKINNIDFYQGDVAKIVKKLEEKPDLIVIDPPRPGLQNAIKDIIEFDADKIVYISCNPKTMIRDLEVFKDYGYTFSTVDLVDQFPRTPHVEAITQIVKK